MRPLVLRVLPMHVVVFVHSATQWHYEIIEGPVQQKNIKSTLRSIGVKVIKIIITKTGFY